MKLLKSCCNGARTTHNIRTLSIQGEKNNEIYDIIEGNGTGNFQISSSS